MTDTICGPDRSLQQAMLTLATRLLLRAATGPVPPLQAGIAFAAKPLLQVAAVPASLWLGRTVGVSPPLALLLGVGTGIRGASAIVTVNQVARARAET